MVSIDRPGNNMQRVFGHVLSSWPQFPEEPPKEPPQERKWLLGLPRTIFILYGMESYPHSNWKQKLCILGATAMKFPIDWGYKFQKEFKSHRMSRLQRMNSESEGGNPEDRHYIISLSEILGNTTPPTPLPTRYDNGLPLFRRHQLNRAITSTSPLSTSNGVIGEAFTILPQLPVCRPCASCAILHQFQSPSSTTPLLIAFPHLSCAEDDCVLRARSARLGPPSP